MPPRVGRFSYHRVAMTSATLVAMSPFAEKLPAALDLAPAPVRWRAVFVASLLLAAAAGFALGGRADVTAVDPELGRLLQFMAAVKGLLSLGLGGAFAWRLGHATPARLVPLYFASGAMLFAAPGLMWRLGYVGLGALFFHAGLLTALAAMGLDGGGKERLWRRVAPRTGAR